jgi:adenosylhomocysteine nucleosidase
VPTVVVLAPMQVELAPVTSRLRLSRTGGARREHRGVVAGVEVVACLAGVGPAPAAESARAAIAAHRPDHVVVSGIAGGMHPSLAIGDLVTPAEVIDAATGRSWAPTPVGADAPADRLLTTATLLSMAELRPHADAGVIAVDMETAAVAEVCAEADVPWVAYRGISDLVDDGLVDDTALSLVKTDGTTNVAGVARLALTRPGRLIRMAKLNGDTRRATGAAAAATEAAVAALGS